MKSYPDLRRQPLMLVMITFISALPLFFMVIFGGEHMLSSGIIGAMIASAGFIGMNAAVQDITWDRYVKIRQMIVAMPVNPASYAIGIALAPLLLSLPGLIFFGALAIWLGVLHLNVIGWVIAALILCWASLSSLGFVISTYLTKSSPYTLSNLSNILSIAMVFIPPVFYPEEMLGNLSWIAILLPTSNAAGIMRAHTGFASMTLNILLLRWLVFIISTVIFIALTVLKARWREV